MTDKINTKDPLESVQEALSVLATGKTTLRLALKETLIEAQTKLNVLLSPQLGFTFDEIFSDPDFEGITKTFKIQFDKVTAKPKAKTKVKNKQSKKKTKKAKGDRLKKGSLKAAILEVMADGKERKRPEISAELEKKGIETSNLYGTSGVGGLVKDGKLKPNGEGRDTTYKIA